MWKYIACTCNKEFQRINENIIFKNNKRERRTCSSNLQYEDLGELGVSSFCGGE